MAYPFIEYNSKRTWLRNSGVYAIVNSCTRKCYVGSGKDINCRWYEHLRILKKREHSRKLQNAVNKYSIEVFIFIVLEFCPRVQLMNKEQYWVNKLNSFRNGYNTRKDVTSNLGMPYAPFSEIHKKRLREARSKQISPMTGRKHSEETKTKMSLSARKRGIPDHVRKAQSIARKGKSTWNKGISPSEETKEKMSAAKRGKPAWNKGIPFSEETRKRMSVARLKHLGRL